MDSDVKILSDTDRIVLAYEYNTSVIQSSITCCIREALEAPTGDETKAFMDRAKVLIDTLAAMKKTYFILHGVLGI